MTVPLLIQPKEPLAISAAGALLAHAQLAAHQAALAALDVPCKS